MPEAPPFAWQLRLASQELNLDEQATLCAAAPSASEPNKSQYLEDMIWDPRDFSIRFLRRPRATVFHGLSARRRWQLLVFDSPPLFSLVTR